MKFIVKRSTLILQLLKTAILKFKELQEFGIDSLLSDNFNEYYSFFTELFKINSLKRLEKPQLDLKKFQQESSYSSFSDQFRYLVECINKYPPVLTADERYDSLNNICRIQTPFDNVKSFYEFST